MPPLSASIDLPHQAHIDAADQFWLLAVVLFKMQSLFLISCGKIVCDLFCNFVVVKEIAFEGEAHELAKAIKPRKDADEVGERPAQDKFKQYVGIVWHLALSHKLLPILPHDELAVIAAVVAPYDFLRLFQDGGCISLRDAELRCDLRLRHVPLPVQINDMSLSCGECGKRAFFVYTGMDAVSERFVLVQPLLLLFGCEGILIDAIADGGSVAEILVRVVIFEAIQFAQHLPFALRHLDHGIRLSAHVEIGRVSGIAGVVVEEGALCFSWNLLLVVVICQLIHALMIAQDI